MKPLKPAVCICALLLATSVIAKSQETKEKQEAPAPHSKDGRKLFGTAEALRVARVFSPRISPDASRVAYLVAENKMEKDKPWKSVTQLWLAPTAGPASVARQYTRSEESVSGIQWSPDGKMVGFLMNAGDEKEKKQQVWFMYVDGGEPWQVTKQDRKSTRLNSSHPSISYAVFCLKKKKKKNKKTHIHQSTLVR